MLTKNLSILAATVINLCLSPYCIVDASTLMNIFNGGLLKTLGMIK